MCLKINLESNIYINIYKCKVWNGANMSSADLNPIYNVLNLRLDLRRGKDKRSERKEN